MKKKYITPLTEITSDIAPADELLLVGSPVDSTPSNDTPTNMYSKERENTSGNTDSWSKGLW